jgi:hypothetical protein
MSVPGLFHVVAVSTNFMPQDPNRDIFTAPLLPFFHVWHFIDCRSI